METLLDKTMGKVRVKVYMESDYHPDLDWIGTFSNEWAEGCLEWNGERHSYKYFHPQPGMEEYAEHDMQRMKAYNRGDWVMVGIVAKVYINGKELGCNSVWGIEWDYTTQDCHLKIMRDVAHCAIKEAREFVSSLQVA